MIQPGRLERTLRSGVILYVALLVALPLTALISVGFADGLGRLILHASAPAARAAIGLTVWSGLTVGGLNILFGTATAWVLVRYRLPGRVLLSAAVDLPLAIPTLVAGIMLATLYGPTSWIGTHLAMFGIELVFAPPGIVLALLFVTLPFVVRAVVPVLAELDPAEEEAAILLGAGHWKTFRTVFFPAILPAAVSGGVRSVGRAVGEFGAIVIVAGNVPFETLTAPVFIFGEIESGAPAAAAAVSIVLLVFALALHGVAHSLEKRTGARRVR